MDALSDVLRVVRLTGGVFLDARFSAPWAVLGNVRPDEYKPFLASPAQVIAFHYLVEGRMTANVVGGEPVELKAGEIVLVPRNDLHILASDPKLPPKPAEDFAAAADPTGIARIVWGGGGEETRMVCGYLGSDTPDNPLIASLPPLLTLNVADTPGGAWIAQSFAFAAQELASAGVGAATIIAKLSELMFVEAVRRHIETLPPEQAGWLAALRDPAIGRALALIHTKPSHPWTAEDLAHEVALSRSSFAERFTQLVGRPPMTYVGNWRMQVAANKLRENRQSIAQIAYDVGYESEASFTRAFRREFGAPPAAWRKRALA